MKHTNLYHRYMELEAIEREELKQAVLAHGGEFYFLAKDGAHAEGVCPPVIMAGNKRWGANCDCVVSRVVVQDDYLKIYGHDLENGGDDVLLDDVEFGHLDFIISEIPETDKVKSVAANSPIYEIPVVSLCREDISDAGYTSEISDDELKQVASRIGKYMEWQDFFSQFLDNVREACNYLGIPALDSDDSQQSCD